MAMLLDMAATGKESKAGGNGGEEGRLGASGAPERVAVWWDPATGARVEERARVPRGGRRGRKTGKVER